MSIQFGTFVPQGWRMDLVEIDDPVVAYEAMTNVGQSAEAAGYDSIWLYDHFHTVPTPEIEFCFEAWTATAALTRDTSTVKIGQMVTSNGYRNPALLAKMASTVDVMSHGRLICGLGAGWYEHEWDAYGYGFPALGDRMKAFAEACELITLMWRDEKASFSGKYHTIDGAINEPKSAGQPIPLWIGGGGEKVTLKLVAKFGAASNFSGNAETLRHKMGVLKQHCENEGRAFDELVRSQNMNIFLLEDGENPEEATAQVRGNTSFEDFSNGTFVGTVDDVTRHIETSVNEGINYIITYFHRVAYDHSQMLRFAAEVMPRFQ